MSICLQDPTQATSPSLHEALLRACKGASAGAGAFAFVTRGGVKLYLQDEVFRNFINKGTFELVVGLDDVTNPDALDSLNEIKSAIPGFKVLAFLHDLSGSIFHPKFCWFRNDAGGTLVVGSGNLTVRGLRSNWEAFSVLQLGKEEFDKVESGWSQWCKDNATRLLAIDDQSVLEKARLNKRRTPRRRRRIRIVTARGKKPVIEHTEDSEAWKFIDTDEVLIAELPRGDRRWNQANFDKESFKIFFGATPGDNTQRVLLRHVTAGGALGEIETRPHISVKSHNWRIELGAAAHRDYPSTGRPITVFIRVSTRMFLYTLIMPAQPGCSEMEAILTARWRGHPGRIRRIRARVAELRRLGPHLPFWQAGLQD